jgi:predicted RNA polymerase sigma factor
VTAQTEIGSLLRELAPQVAGRLVRRYGDFDNCEDAVQVIAGAVVGAFVAAVVMATLA